MDRMFPVMLDAGDDFQAATYTALTGSYRLSIAALRSALELTAIGAWAQVCGKHKEFTSGEPGQFLSHSLTHATDSSERLQLWRRISGRRQTAAFSGKKVAVARAALRERCTAAYRSSLIRAPDTPMGTCARATARYTCARSSTRRMDAI